ncbi:SGNH/GDSL hydrolase family protein [Nocardia sp. NBC_01329]|uniref:SGNH/GDSL hydrolase family protein n=1 Tax=Nocardia sp. NBC_01329 TaxID=2903594 RepID=UPI002E14D8FF|nr:GDSL-type esterase/lipase family protein [Nocardia sp. NBC_01329]
MRPFTARKRALLVLAVTLAAALGATGTVGYLTFLRSPVDSPPRACRGAETSGGPVVVAAGASMTRGILGADWVGALRKRDEFGGHRFVNAGVNGNTSADLLDRLETDVLDCRPDAVIVLVGTNDVRNDVALDTYRDNLTAIVGRITTVGTAHVALMSLPPLGEDPDDETNRRLAGYNRVIAETAAGAGIDYIPLHERIAELVQQPADPSARYDFGFTLAFAAAAQHYLFGRTWDQVAHSRGSDLFVDRIHLSDRSGAVVTELTAHWLATTLR